MLWLFSYFSTRASADKDGGSGCEGDDGILCRGGVKPADPRRSPLDTSVKFAV